ncbi:uncharacterized protein AMSG_04852 [Thecamonas trahens ATCC 50062]|uniref:Phytanoyl-CoA dioxygenase n=1 Tax=Thecamonas trahens ATCC 50062 TaxID=461836 RepID=A0A0L0DAS9_THETB|nr:hypothetical protein AMSG_04852 [Thecamonas trahens ATCC 50062]KNC48403.1 hypothetical protein AMSG_04852 [Thecamonas trahens ATCC 50062]|eukprot:XP_013758520.1 hypothetical protein AMSG_04852 [Thecamonas trahens ATCC 50062]
MLRCLSRTLVPLRYLSVASRMSESSSSATSSGFDATQRFLFDLNGFIVLRGVLDANEVASLQAAVDAHASEAVSRDAGALKNAKDGSALSAPGSRRDLGGMLGWEGVAGDAFRSLLVHPRIAPYLVDLLGEGYRLDHQPIVLVQDGGSEGFSLHGGPLTSSGTFNPELQYRAVAGQMWTSLLACAVHLSEAQAGDGGFCVVPGSHKANFPVPPEFATGDAPAFAEHIHQPVVSPGDVVLFSEATVHGALPWTADHQRRVALFRFATPSYGYGRAYLEEFGGDVLSKCTPEQAAVLLPPYAPRLERPIATRPGASATPRSEAKKAHDRAVFNTSYF